jgi:hypothetical protein
VTSALIGTLTTNTLQVPLMVRWFCPGWPMARQFTCHGLASFSTVPEPSQVPPKRPM